MTYYHVRGEPVWKFALRNGAKILIPLLILLIGLHCGRSCYRDHLRRFGVSLFPPEDKRTPLPPAIDFYSMQDPKWASVKLGETGKTVKEAGEALLCAAMALNSVGFRTNPSDLADALGRKGFESTGEIDWQEVAATTQRQVSVAYAGASDEDVLKSALRSHCAAILLVGEPEEGNRHWVLVRGQTTKTYLVLDPRDGRIVSLEVYRNRARWMVIYQGRG